MRNGGKARFDRHGFQAALDSTRIARGLTWKQVAEQSGVSASTLSRMTGGANPDLDGLAALTCWSGLSADSFIPGMNPKEHEPMAEISHQIMSDTRLTREARGTMDELTKVMYQRFSAMGEEAPQSLKAQQKRETPDTPP